MENWPIEYPDQLILGNPQSCVAVCCLWWRSTRIRDLLDPMQYCLIGNLYSRAGISPMLRNILANPRIRYLLLVGDCLTDSDHALVGFFERGVDEEWRIRGTEGRVDPDIPREVLDEVRQAVTLVDLRQSANLGGALVNAIAQCTELPPFAEPRVFPKTTPIVLTFPSERLGCVVRGTSLADVWVEILWTVMQFGRVSGTDYGLQQKEVIDLVSIVEEPDRGLDRVPDWAPFRAEDVAKYVAFFLDPRVGGQATYSYGERLAAHWGFDQVELLAAELHRSRQSRRAVAVTWDPSADLLSVEPPCVILVQFLLREDRLHASVYIRSNDMLRAYPLNAAAVAMVQTKLASELHAAVGELALVSASAHVYSDCWEQCSGAVKEFDRHLGEPIFVQDPRGSFALRLDGEDLVADLFSPKGDLFRTFRTQDSERLMAEVLPFVSRIDHAAYLGRELECLSRARVEGRQYRQGSVGTQNERSENGRAF